MRQLTEAGLDIYQKYLQSNIYNPNGGGGANNPQTGVKTCNCVGQHHHGGCIALNGVLSNPPQGGSIGISSSGLGYICLACGHFQASAGNHTCGISTTQPKSPNWPFTSTNPACTSCGAADGQYHHKDCSYTASQGTGLGDYQPDPNFTPHYLEPQPKPAAYKCLTCNNSALTKEDLNVNPVTGNIWGCFKCGSKRLELL